MPDIESSPAVADTATDIKPDALEASANTESTQETVQTPDAKQEGQPTPSEAVDTDANKKPGNLLDAVKNAAEKSRADADSSTVGTKGTSDATAEQAEPKASLDDTTQGKRKADAAEKVPFHNHPRWKEMISERDALKPKADQFEKITNFMQANGLSNEEVVEGFQIMALMKTNPSEAHKKISEYKAKLDPFVGEKLPDDVAKRVEEGFIDEDTAKELAKLKAEKGLMQQQQAAAIQRQTVEGRNAIRNVVVNWEQQMKAKDPDWSAKQDLVTDQVKLMLQAEQPSNPEEALALVERAHSITAERLRRFAPKRQPVSTSTSATSSASAVPVPRSLSEAIRAGIASTR